VLLARRAVFPAGDVDNSTLINDPGRAREALLANRLCDEWCEYIPGLDPRDHLMERRLRELEDDRRAFQTALDSHSANLVRRADVPVREELDDRDRISLESLTHEDGDQPQRDGLDIYRSSVCRGLTVSLRGIGGTSTVKMPRPTA